MTTVEQASAAASGASATERFHADKSPFEAVKDTPAERVDMLAREVLDALHETIRKHKVSYAEYNALKAWLINVGQDGEWPLFLDVWVEHVVEDVATEHREGNKGSIEGPYYVPDAPECGAVGTIPMRDDEAGTPLVWEGRISSTDGTPLAGKIELWHADSDGFYSQFAPGLPQWNLRGSFSTGPDGNFAITTMRPGAVPDPHRRFVRQVDLRRRLARLAPGPPARQGVRTRTRTAHRAAVLPRRPAQRRRHRQRRQTRTDARSTGPARRHREDHLQLHARPRSGLRISTAPKRTFGRTIASGTRHYVDLGRRDQARGSVTSRRLVSGRW